MKIVVVAPHPDDEIYGCGGSILKWMDEGHDVHIVYVTDNRAFIWWGKKKNSLLIEEAKDYIAMTEEELAEACLKEAEAVATEFGFLSSNIHFFKIHDQTAMKNIDLGVKLIKEIIYDADRIVLPSDNNNHNDHQATHTMVKIAAKELNLRDVGFYVYAIYNILKIPKERQIKSKIAKYRERKYELMAGYKSQLCLKNERMGWQTFKYKLIERFGVFRFEDMDKFENF
jgi:LmbE family N-acetylglucosaminyl deacetylase